MTDQQFRVAIRYGQDGEHVIIQYSVPVQVNRMTLEESRDMRAKLEQAEKQLVAARKKGKH